MAKLTALQKLMKNPKTAKFVGSLKHADLPKGWADDPEIVKMAEDAYREMGTDSPFWRAYSKVTGAGQNEGVPQKAYHGGGDKIMEFSPQPGRGNLGAAYFTEDKNAAAKYALLGGIDDSFDELSDYGYALAKTWRDGNKKALKRRPTITEAYLNIKNPLDPVDSNITWDDVIDTLGEDRIVKNVKDDSSLYDRFGDNEDDIVEWLSDRKNLKDYLRDEYSNDELYYNIIDNDIKSFTDESGQLTPRSEFLYLVGSGQLDDFMRKKGYDGIKYFDNEIKAPTIVVRDPNQIKSVYNRGTFNPDDPNIYKGILGALATGGIAAGAGEAQAAEDAAVLSRFNELAAAGALPGQRRAEEMALTVPVRYAADPWRGMSLGARAVTEGVLGAPGEIANAVISPFTDFRFQNPGVAVADMMGQAKPVTGAEKTMSNVVRGASDALPYIATGAGLAKMGQGAVTQGVGRSLADSPKIQAMLGGLLGLFGGE